jgi:hypothetical protein
MSIIKQIYDIKGSAVTKESGPRLGSRYITHCQLCGWYGYPFEKIILDFEGFRPEEEDGFAYKFTEYDAATIGERRIKHIHKYDPILVQEAIAFALRMRNGG